MNDFNSLFPNFLNLCGELNRLLTPVAVVLFVVGVVSSTVSGHRSASAHLRTVARTAVYVAVLASLLTWGNEVATIIDDAVKTTLQANPKAVHNDYQKALSLQKGTGSSGSSKSWWDLLDSQAIFEGLLSCILWVFGWLAGVIVFYAYLTQKFILYIAYGFAPLFIGLQLRLPCSVRSACRRRFRAAHSLPCPRCTRLASAICSDLLVSSAGRSAGARRRS